MPRPIVARSPYPATACDAWNMDEPLEELLPAPEPPVEDEFDVTGKSLAEVLAVLEKHGVGPEAAWLEYGGCGSHEVTLTLTDPHRPAVPKAARTLPPKDAYRRTDDGITDPNMLDLPEEPLSWK